MSRETKLGGNKFIAEHVRHNFLGFSKVIFGDGWAGLLVTGANTGSYAYTLLLHFDESILDIVGQGEGVRADDARCLVAIGHIDRYLRSYS